MDLNIHIKVEEGYWIAIVLLIIISLAIGELFKFMALNITIDDSIRKPLSDISLLFNRIGVIFIFLLLIKFIVEIVDIII